MFGSRSPVVKIAGYAIIGFFVLIIIISFGMPEFMSPLGMDKSIVAVVNGEKVHHLDFLRYRNSVSQRVPDANSKEMQHYILDSMIRYRLQLQKARELGMQVSDDRVKRVIREMPMFRDESGKFNRQHLDLFLDHHHLSLNDYYVMVREDLINEELVRMIQNGVGVSRDEIITRNAVDNSRIQIRYCYASNSELRRRWADILRVSDAEIDGEFAANRSEVKDPKTDRERVKTKLEDRKFEAKKKEIIGEIDRLSMEGGSFERAAARLGGGVRTSSVFKVGEPVREAGEKGNVLYSLSDSPLFIGDCLALKSGSASRVIASFDGLYVFTPVRKEVPLGEPVAAQYGAMDAKLRNDKANAVYISMMTVFLEKSKVSKNLNFD
ncbi:MAG TPA: SurA N-terminal domain-containing protein [Spirochaetota bacterium]|nr:SurA N-terminal domain-containing protein [Spirochaetota bacterium]